MIVLINFLTSSPSITLSKGDYNWNSRPFIDDIHMKGYPIIIINIGIFVTRDGDVFFFFFPTPIVVALTMLCIQSWINKYYHTNVLDLNKLQQTIHAFMFNHEVSLFKQVEICCKLNDFLQALMCHTLCHFVQHIFPTFGNIWQFIVNMLTIFNSVDNTFRNIEHGEVFLFIQLCVQFKKSNLRTIIFSLPITILQILH